MMTREICEEDLLKVRVLHFFQHMQAILFKFLINSDMHKIKIKSLQHYVFDVDLMRKSLLLFKDLIAEKILIFALQQKQ
jgi:hypothetical protein